MTLRFDMSTGKTCKTGALGILTQLGGMQAPRGLVGGILLRDTPPGKESFAKYRRMHF
jgi:hypothetical protein